MKLGTVQDILNEVSTLGNIEQSHSDARKFAKQLGIKAVSMDDVFNYCSANGLEVGLAPNGDWVILRGDEEIARVH